MLATGSLSMSYEDSIRFTMSEAYSMQRFLLSSLLFSVSLTWACSYDGKSVGSVVNDVKDVASSQSQFAFHLNLPAEIRNDVFTVQFGCEMLDGSIRNGSFDKQEILAGLNDKIIREERPNVRSCESSLVIQPYARPRSETDTPLWAPVDFGVIEQRFEKIEDVLEIGLGDWKVQTLSIALSKEAFDKRKATEVLLSVSSDGYLFQFPDRITQITKENAPQSFKSRILYRGEPSFNVSPVWITNDGFSEENFVTKNFDINVD